MDTSEQMTVVAGSHVKRQRRSVEEKRRIVEETLETRRVGGTCSAAACRQRQPDLRLAEALSRMATGELDGGKLLPVAITDERMVETEKVGVPVPQAPLGIIEMVLPKGKLRIEGRVELSTLRAAIECLL